ncbi:MAG TPA: ABC transporter permease, partial [Acidimicrobiales bacterium]|nr:ABC transporter permease [Acidimicrobiales bacterium]
MTDDLPTAPAGRDRFGQLVHAEWTKFRTVGSWVIGTVVAAVVLVGLSVLSAEGSKAMTCTNGKCTIGGPSNPIGPGGEPVVDTYFFVHRTLDGNGSLTVEVTSLAGQVLGGAGNPVVSQSGGQTVLHLSASGLQPWSKAGLILEPGMRQGVPYAAVMLTGSHGVRMQYDYTHDIAGLPGTASPASPRWLRLTRVGDAVTAYDSADGRLWDAVGATTLPLTAEVEVGMFVTSPNHTQQKQHVGSLNGSANPTLAQARFAEAALTGRWLPAPWTGTSVQGPIGIFYTLGPTVVNQGQYRSNSGTFVLRGSGDIAPASLGVNDSTETGLVGSFLGLIVMIILATLFITSEYRRGLIHTTMTASPRRGRVLAAKAVVIGAVMFVTTAIAVAVALPLFNHVWRSNGNQVFPISSATELRVILGTALLLALCSILTLAVGTVLRRSAGAVTAVIVIVILPFILSRAAVLPAGISEWVLRLTPAAAFAVQQTIPVYSQVAGFYTPAQGYFPLAPLAGLGVLCLYCAVA